VRRAAAAILVGALVVVLVAFGSFATASARKSDPTARRLLVISLPAVNWKDVNTRHLPNLNKLLDESAVADLTTRTVNHVTRLADGYVTIGTGTRAVGGPTQVETDGEGFEVGEPFGDATAGQVFTRRTGHRPGDGLVNLGLGGIVDKNDEQLFDAHVGELGDTLGNAGWSRSVIANGDGTDPEQLLTGPYRRYAVSSLMGPEGRVPEGATGPELLVPDPAAPFGLRYDNAAVLRAFQNTWTDRSVVLVEASDLVREDAYRQLATSQQRDQLFDRALRRTDELIGGLLRRVDPKRDAVMVVGPAHAQREVQLTIASLRAPGVDPGLLRSGTTRRDGFVQLVDIAPTILERVGLKVPSSMEGSAVEVGSKGASAADRRTFLQDADTAATFRDDNVSVVPVVLLVIQGVLAVAALVWLAGRGPSRLNTGLRLGALAALSFIPAVLLARILPFENWGDVAYWPFLFALSFVLAGLCVVAGRRDPLEPLMLGLGVIVAVLVVDVLIGTPLQFNNPFGYSPKVAGRFAGFGNLGYSALAAAAVVLAGLLAHRIRGRRGAYVAVGLLVVVFVADGAPFWGADVGGVLSILPAFAVTGYILLGLRLRLRTIALSLLAAVATVVAFGLIDLARPADQRTHLGRLFSTTGSEGSAGLWTVIERKIYENVSVLFSSTWLLTVLLILGFLGYLYARHRDRLHAIVEAVPELRASFVGFAIVVVLGFALNDSGIAIPGMMLSVLSPAIVTLLIATRPRVPAAEMSPSEPEPARVPEPA
jgi:hypothetical protein